MAASASVSRSSTGSRPVTLMATPMLAETVTSRPPTSTGAPSSSRMRAATSVAPPGSSIRSSSTANSSPPRRATTSPGPDAGLEPAGHA